MPSGTWPTANKSLTSRNRDCGHTYCVLLTPELFSAGYICHANIVALVKVFSIHLHLSEEMLLCERLKNTVAHLITTLYNCQMALFFTEDNTTKGHSHSGNLLSDISTVQ